MIFEEMIFPILPLETFHRVTIILDSADRSLGKVYHLLG